MRRAPVRNAATGLTLAAALAYVSIGAGRALYPYDEGIIAHGAERVLAGAVPYRDFWSAYSPGQFYLLAALYKLFGISLMAGRAYTLAAEFSIVICAFLLSRRMVGNTRALMACASVAVWLGYAGRPLYPAIPAMACALAGFCLIGRSGLLPHALAGFMAGCALLLRHDLGLYALPAQILSIAAYAWFECYEDKHRTPRARLVRLLLAYAAGASVILLPAAAFILFNVPFRLLYEIFVRFPAGDYARIRELPLPSPGLGIDALSRLLPLVLIGAAVTSLLLTAGRLRAISGFRDAGAITSFGLALLLTARVRPDVEHMAAPMIAVLIVLPWVFARLGRFTAALLIVPCALLLAECIAVKAIQCGMPTRPVHIERAAGIYIATPPDALEDAVRYVVRNTAPGERIFVGNARHDRIFINHALFYFLSGRASCTRYHELLPGVATTATVQREILGEIEAHKVRYVVLWLAAQRTEPNRSSETGATLLDEWIGANCREVHRSGDFAVLRRIQ